MNSSTEIIEGFETLNSIGLSVFDAKCYRALALKIIEAIKVFPEFALRGNETCYNYLFIMLSVDMSVFADATIELLMKTDESRQDMLSEESPDFSKRLKSVRNNIHLYNKHGSYKSKADNIIAHTRRKYNTDIPNELHAFRTDDLLIYRIQADRRLLCGSQLLFFEHSFERKKFEWTGEQQRKYSQSVASIVNTIANLDVVSVPDVAQHFLTINSLQLESFNDKMSDVFGQLPTSEATAFRLLLVLTRISYALLVIDLFVDKIQLGNYPEWLCFFTKWLAIHYDEARDSLDNLQQYSKSEDALFLKGFLLGDCFSTDSNELRIIAAKLRNMIHYGGYPVQIYNNSDSIPEVNPYRLFSEATGICTWSKIVETFNSLEVELKKMESYLRRAFGTKGIISERI